MRIWTLRARRSAPVVNDPPHAALLFVHGMGAQRSRETLFEWADPFLRRLQHRLVDQESVPDLLSAAPMRVLDHSTSATGEASLLVEINGGLGAAPLRLRLQESTWSESFLPLSRKDIFNWAARFMWTALGRALRHFSGVIGTRVANPEHTAYVVWLGALLAWIAIVPALWGVAFLLAVVLSVLLALSSFLLVIPPIRDAIASVMLAIVEALGDPAVLVSRPARASAMRGHVAASLKALAADAGPAAPITVVAHSQGAAIVAEMLFAVGGATNARTIKPESRGQVAWDREGVSIDTLITVGAGVSLLGKGYSQGGPLLGQPVGAWQRSEMANRWINIWATWDPVSTGPIVDKVRAKREGEVHEPEALRMTRAQAGACIEEIQVRNTASPFTDHQSYPANTVEVIDPIIDAVLTSRSIDPMIDAALRATSMACDSGARGREGPEKRKGSWVRLIRMHGMNRIVIVSTALAVAFTSAVLDVGVIKKVVSIFYSVLPEPLKSWLSPVQPLAELWIARGLVLLTVVVVLLWVSTRLRAAAERTLVWGLPGWWIKAKSAMHVPFTVLNVLGSAVTLSIAFAPITNKSVQIAVFEVHQGFLVGAGVFVLWAIAFWFARNPPRVQRSATRTSPRIKA